VTVLRTALEALTTNAAAQGAAVIVLAGTAAFVAEELGRRRGARPSVPTDDLVDVDDIDERAERARAGAR